MRLGYGFGVTMPYVPPVAAAAAAALSSINADGWSGQWANMGTLPAYSTGGSEFQPDTSPILVPLVRKGFDTNGNLLTNISENVVVTRRVRRPYTDSTANTHLLGDETGRVALSDPVYLTDLMTGGNVASTVRSPKPIAQWCRRNRRVVTTTLRVEIVAFHRDARGNRPVQAITCTVKDANGVTTAPVLMTGPVVLGGEYDKFAVIGYYADVNVSALADGVITSNAKVYPRIGDGDSVLDSETSGIVADAAGFGPRSHFKSVKGSTPPLAYVATNGTDETVNAAGVGATSATQKVSTDANVAKANPFLTPKSALEALKAATTVTGGFTDGCRVRFKPGTYTAANTLAGTYQQGGEVILEADPETATADTALIAWAPSAMRQLYITWRNLGFTRNSTTQIGGATGGRLAMVGCKIANGGYAGLQIGTSAWFEGCAVTDTSSAFFHNGTLETPLIRGNSIAAASGTVPALDGRCVIGNDAPNASVGNSRPIDGGVWAFNRSLRVTATKFGVGTGQPVKGFAIVQNVWEWTSTTAAPMMRPSGDSETNWIEHFIEWHNTYAGVSLYGRHNMGYDETPNTYRENRLWSQVGNIYPTTYTKHDWFVGALLNTGAAEAQLHVKSWPVMYQVGARGNFVMNSTDSGTGPNGGPNGDRNPAFFGLGSKYATSPTTAGRLNPLFTDDKAVTFNGATATDNGGGGTYTLQSTSPAKSMVPDSPLPFDLNGTPRAALSSAGAYV